MIKIVPSGVTSKHTYGIMPVFLKVLTVFKYKWIYYYAITSIITSAWIFIELTVFFIMEPTKDLWFHHGPVLTVSLPTIIQMLFCLVGFQKWEKLRDFFETQPCDFTCLPNELKENMQKFCRKSDLFCIGAVISLQICTLFDQIQLTPSFLSLYLRVLQDPIAAKVVAVYVGLNTQFMTTFMLWAPFSVQYFFIVIRLQLEVLLFTLREFERKAPPTNCTQHQSYVLKELREFVKNHQHIMKEISMLKTWAFWSIIFAGCNAIFLLGFYAIMLFSPYCNYTLTLLLYVTTVTNIFYFCHEGQVFEDLVSEVSNQLYNLEWYRWDRDSADIFKVLFTNVSTHFTLNNNNILQVNHVFFKQYVAIAYALINLIAAIALK